MTIRKTLLSILILLAPLTHADNLPDVQQASQSVYRVWQGIPLPIGFVKQLDGQYIQALQTQHIAEQVPLKGMSLKQKSSGKIKALSGEGMLFHHAGHHYLLVASGSAYAISAKGHVVSHTKVVDDTANSEAMFIDETGLRDVGANGGQTQVFILDKNQQGGALVLRPAKPLARDVQHGLVVLQVDNLPTRALKLADSQFAKPAERVFALGAEGELNQLSGKQNAIDRVDYFNAIANEGKLDKRVKQKQVGLWLHSAPISGSMSGGALVNQCGQVLGTNQLGEVQGLAAAIDAGELLPLLRKHSIPFEVYQGRCGGVVAKAENIADGAGRVVQAAQHNPRGWLTVLGLAILGLVATVVAWKLLWWTLRKRKMAQAANKVHAHAPAAPYTPPPVAPSVSPTPPVSPSHHVPQKTHHDIPAAPRTILDTYVYLETLSGSLKWVLVSNKPQIIGRRGDCEMILSHPNVSAQHLKIWLEQAQVWVQDLGSTNGTFINGQRLGNQALILREGDILQLTSDENVARFRLPENTSYAAAAPKTHFDSWQLKPLHAAASSIVITAGQGVKIGRAAHNDVVVNVPVVSGSHCRVWLDETGSLNIQDLGSTNGTFIDDFKQKITHAKLQTGQTIYLADQQTGYRVEKG